MKQYNKYVSTAKALKNQLLGAFDNDYFLSMYDQATGKLCRTTRIARIEKCMDTAANGGTLYSQEQILTIAFDAMYQIGLYNEKCITWEDLPTADKTWPWWKTFFTIVVRDHHCLQQAAGSHFQANSAVQEALQQDTIDALANLASATPDDCNAVASLTSSNATLASQTKRLTKNTTKHKEALDSMKSNIADILSLLQDTLIRPQRSNRSRQGNRGGRGNCGNYQQWYQNRQQCNAPAVHYC
eukprot:13246411-Ditylum_brightwellii.AAC.1